MSSNALMQESQARSVFSDYLELCKPKVVALMLLTAVVGMFLATPGWVGFMPLIFGSIGIGFCASSAATINHLVDRHIDAIMARTQKRPVAKGKVSPKQAMSFAFIMGLIGMVVLVLFVNTLTACLTFMTLIGYAVIYTGFLKRATPQNIVIGGLAGAAPPLLGWTSVTGSISAQALLLVLIIFTWTPPHFWALAIYRFKDYEKAKIPMLPVTHGIPFTKLNIVFYTILLVAVTVLPYAISASGLIYLFGALALGGRFIYWSLKLWKSDKAIVAMQTFRFSIVYLMLLFVILLTDHYCLIDLGV